MPAPDPVQRADAPTAGVSSTETPVADGILDGGWTYIWAAYGVTWTFLAGYAVSLLIRRLVLRGVS